LDVEGLSESARREEEEAHSHAMSSYYLSRDGRQLGPFSEHELRGMLSNGLASSADLACVVGDTQWRPLGSMPGFAVVSGAGGETVVSGIIPYKNPPALIGYYLGVFSLIPCVGLLLGLAAVILGIIGLKKSAAAPGSKGTAHAWTAIVLGSIGILISAGLGAAFFIGAAGRH